MTTPRTFTTTRKSKWTVAEIGACRAEVEAADRAALIAEGIVLQALQHKSDPDVFYPNIASAYRRFELVIGKPTTNIALAADVPHTTAAKWVREARRRELLAGAK